MRNKYYDEHLESIIEKAKIKLNELEKIKTEIIKILCDYEHDKGYKIVEFAAKINDKHNREITAPSSKYSNFRKEMENIRGELDKCKEEIISSKNPLYLYSYAYLTHFKDYENGSLSINDTNFVELEHGINSNYYENYISEAKREDIELIERTIIESKDTDCIYLFARDIKYANVDLLKETLIDLGDEEKASMLDDLEKSKDKKIVLKQE